MAEPSPATSAPPDVAYVVDLLRGFGQQWFLCGGWAADAWLGGQTRRHADVDIAVFHDDQQAIFRQFPGWALVGHDPHVPDDTNEVWKGRRLDLPAHIHVCSAASSLVTPPELTRSQVEFEFLLNERRGQEWILNREKHIALALDECVRWSPWGLPAATPEVVLFYKGGGHLAADEIAARGDAPRPHDEQDFDVLLPALTEAQRGWLATSLAQVRPGHPWLARLAPSA
jgi:hypothetical protein